ncbi:MAG: hypothetical protein AAFZ15_14160 [Bacteroidota bacterium]
MLNLIIQPDKFAKVYLKKSTDYQYDSLLDLIQQIFSTHAFEDKAVEQFLYQLLSETGYTSLEKIPIPELQAIANYFLAHKDEYKIDYDAEKLTYLLLSAIKNKDVIVYIDKRIVEDMLAPITLQYGSTLAFIKVEKINNITFKTI